MSLDLPTPASFPAFPFSPPYNIQNDLMQHLYTSIEQKKVTIVESPTGTGKTLSLLCASLTWLTDERNRARKGKMIAMAGPDDDNDWVARQTRERLARELESQEDEYRDRLAAARKKEAEMKKKLNARAVKRPRTLPSEKPKPIDEEEDDDIFLPAAEEPDEDDNLSPAVKSLMAKLAKGSGPGLDPAEEELTCTKIYYASRTHSQLMQIVPELQRLKLHIVEAQGSCSSSPAIAGSKRPAPDHEGEDDDAPVAYTRTVSLGSRKQLCINDDLRKKTKDIDEACREILDEKGDKRCQFLPPLDEEDRMLDFRDQILAAPKDIEELASVGHMNGLCPYFGSRRAITQAELITLPYNLLLQQSAREALGIDLTDQIVIIDEAHNLIPTLLSLSTHRLTFSTLALSFSQICIYVSKFRIRLSQTNMLHLKRLVVFTDALKKYVAAWERHERRKKEKMEVVSVADLVGRLGPKVASINLLEVTKYLKQSKIARKIANYSDKQAEKNTDSTSKPSQIRKGAIPPLHRVEEFLECLTATNEDGRVCLSLIGSAGKEDVEIKYQLLNPAPHFLGVVEAARSVILAGGTMSPISDFMSQLFSTIPAERVTSFSCGHIIPSTNLLGLTVGKGPSGTELEYKAEKQSDRVVIIELGQIVSNLVAIAPGGVIVFFPSYRFLNTAKAQWQTSGLLDRFGKKKAVFFEPEETTAVESVMQEYASAIRNGVRPVVIHPFCREIDDKLKSGSTKGAVLFAVIGAKLSEGLNFADDLARAVVVVGLPFANLGSAELQERMKYVKRLEEKRGVKKVPGQKDAAAELYENMCMNAVNQSIGRAIRHRGDWAALILLDKRYATGSIRGKLPKWIAADMKAPRTFGQTMQELGRFFMSKRT